MIGSPLQAAFDQGFETGLQFAYWLLETKQPCPTSPEDLKPLYDKWQADLIQMCPLCDDRRLEGDEAECPDCRFDAAYDGTVR